jgi:hypothetical protein
MKSDISDVKLKVRGRYDLIRNPTQYIVVFKSRSSSEMRIFPCVHLSHSVFQIYLQFSTSAYLPAEEKSNVLTFNPLSKSYKLV